jgi:hypothetical protein
VLNVPGEHGIHVEDPVVVFSVRVPAGHVAQATAPEVDVNVPVGHVVHEVDPPPEPKLPGAQGVHVVDPGVVV